MAVEWEDMRETMTFKELDTVRIPEDVPELDVRRGDRGVIATVWDDGRMLDVEIPKDDGTSAGFVDLKVLEGGSTRVVGYAKLS
jgi:hypothetical protein